MTSTGTGAIRRQRPHPGTNGSRGQLSHKLTLAKVDLHALRGQSWSPARIELDETDTRAILHALRHNSERSTGELIARLRAEGRLDAEHVGRSLHQVLTHKRFRKGPRSNFAVSAAIETVRPFVAEGAPVPVMLQGFPLKQHDNRLKNGGPLPDLAEIGALLRLVELERVFTALYPPGLDITVLCDGGYYRPRAADQLRQYHEMLDRFEHLLGVTGKLRRRDKTTLYREILGPTQWAERNERVEHYRHRLATLLRPAAGSLSVQAADDLLNAAPAGTFPPDLPAFGSLLGSLLYSVPVPGADPDPEWSRQVLADVSDTASAPELLSQARRHVVATAWDHAVGYLAVCAADRELRVDDALPSHVRLRTGVSGAGEIGFTYLGGSALLPWHGTGCVDERGQLAADFAAIHRDRGFVPLYSSVTGPEQPLAMLPPQLTEGTGAVLRPHRELPERIRLRSR